MFATPKFIKHFQSWVFHTRHFRRIGKAVAGKYYNDNRYAIKRHIRERVESVMKGFDLTCQTQLFRSNVEELAEISRRIEKLQAVCEVVG